MKNIIVCDKTDCVFHMTHIPSFWFDSKYMPNFCRLDLCGLEDIRNKDGKCIDYKKLESGGRVMELISRKKLKEIIEPMVGMFDDEGGFWWSRESILRVIDNAPTIEERKEGHWIDHRNEGYVECPFCGSCTTCEDNIDELHFCFNCGARMKGVE